jgi:hypothetical protein
MESIMVGRRGWVRKGRLGLGMKRDSDKCAEKKVWGGGGKGW